MILSEMTFSLSFLERFPPLSYPKDFLDPTHLELYLTLPLLLLLKDLVKGSNSDSIFPLPSCQGLEGLNFNHSIDPENDQKGF
jgi:hypothetical protein